MADSQRKRDPRYTRTVGEKPDLGRRYVENGKVKIEWYEGDKRRSRTIGDNSAKTRREADEELERLLGLADSEPDKEKAEEAMKDADEELEEELEEEFEEECVAFDISGLVEELRGHAEVLMDVADDLAERFERGLVGILDVFRQSDEEAEDDSDVEDADVVEEIEDTDETD